jgi:hypothetical protein
MLSPPGEVRVGKILPKGYEETTQCRSHSAREEAWSDMYQRRQTEYPIVRLERREPRGMIAGQSDEIQTRAEAFIETKAARNATISHIHGDAALHAGVVNEVI